MVSSISSTHKSIVISNHQTQKQAGFFTKIKNLIVKVLSWFKDIFCCCYKTNKEVTNNDKSQLSKQSTKSVTIDPFTEKKNEKIQFYREELEMLPKKTEHQRAKRKLIELMIGKLEKVDNDSLLKTKCAELDKRLDLFIKESFLCVKLKSLEDLSNKSLISITTIKEGNSILRRFGFYVNFIKEGNSKAIEGFRKNNFAKMSSDISRKKRKNLEEIAYEDFQIAGNFEKSTASVTLRDTQRIFDSFKNSEYRLLWVRREDDSTFVVSRFKGQFIVSDFFSDRMTYLKNHEELDDFFAGEKPYHSHYFLQYNTPELSGRKTPGGRRKSRRRKKREAKGVQS